jgi:hypothetical protein
VLYVYGLLAADAWPGPFEPAKALLAAESLGIGGVAALLVAALLLGLVLHPFQFRMTQLLEGYWGRSCVGLRLARWRIMHYRRMTRSLDGVRQNADTAWQSAVEKNVVEAKRRTPDQLALQDLKVRRSNNLLWLDSGLGDPGVADYLRTEATRAALRGYPVFGRRIMPTRLGNVLRRYEDNAGQQYGLDILTIAPHLNLVAVKEHREYVDDCRQGLDLGVRLCILFALATVLSVGLLIGDGAWLLFALVPYSISYLAYRGAVSSAHAYGTALLTLVDLNRFALYDQLHVSLPSSAEVECKRNVQLLEQMSGETPDSLRYTHRRQPTSQ